MFLKSIADPEGMYLGRTQFQFFPGHFTVEFAYFPGISTPPCSDSSNDSSSV